MEKKEITLVCVPKVHLALTINEKKAKKTVVFSPIKSS
jgi:hypothetical protein